MGSCKGHQNLDHSSNRWPFQAKLEVSVPYLVGGLEHFFLVNLWLIYISGWWFGTMEWIMTFHILGVLTPTDFHTFQRGRYTTNQICKDKEADPWRPRCNGPRCPVLSVRISFSSRLVWQRVWKDEGFLPDTLW